VRAETRVLAGGSPLALEERGDPPVAIGWPLVDEATDIGGQFDIAGPDLWRATPTTTSLN
jgi:hypothetical protein